MIILNYQYNYVLLKEVVNKLGWYWNGDEEQEEDWVGVMMVAVEKRMKKRRIRYVDQLNLYLLMVWGVHDKDGYSGGGGGNCGGDREMT